MCCPRHLTFASKRNIVNVYHDSFQFFHSSPYLSIAVKRVRALYESTCIEILQRRSDALLDGELKFDSIETYNRAVAEFEAVHGIPWCLDRAFVPFPKNDFCFSVIMPVFNEAKTIAEMIQRVGKVDLPMELVIVDDGSTDGTSDVLRRLRDNGSLTPCNAFGPLKIQLLFHEVNQGKGAALRTGFKAATGDIVGIQDADQEYNPQEFIPLISTILLDEADVVYGSRFANGNRTSSPGWHRFGNGVITRFSNFRTGLKLTDAETCYKLMRKSVLNPLLGDLKENRFGIELEMTAKLAKQPGIRFDERPISYEKRTYAEGKKIGVRDGFRAMWCIMKY